MERVKTSQNDLKPQNSPIGTKRRSPNHSNAFRNLIDRLSACTGSQSVDTGMKMAANDSRTVRTCPNNLKPPNSPSGTTSQCSGKPNGCRDQMDASSVCTDSHSTVNGVKMTANAPQTVSTLQIRLKPPDSPLEAAWQHSDGLNTCRNNANVSSIDSDDMESSSNIDSQGVKGAWLSTKNCPYGLAWHQLQCGRIKFTPVKVSQT